MESNQNETAISRRSVLRTAGGAAGASLGVAASTGVGSAGKDKTPCPTCDEEKGGPTRYKIAHRPPGNPERCIELCLPEPAARAHLRQHDHDTCGPCENGQQKEKKWKKGKEKKERKKGKEKKGKK